MKFLFSVFFFIVIVSFLSSTIINVPGDQPTIQAGIDIAVDGDTVLVQPDTYIENINYNGKNITVASLFLTTQNTTYILDTIIDGNNDNWRLVTFENGETEEAKLIGFTIKNGYCRYSYRENAGGVGIYIINSSPSIENNIIEDNNCGWYLDGCGIGIQNSSAKIKNNIIRNNDGAYYGGGIYVYQSEGVLIENNMIYNHITQSGYGVAYGAGICINQSNNILAINNLIYNNTVDFGSGGGVAFLESSSELINVTITDNSAYWTDGGGIACANYSSATLIDCILWNDSPQEIYISSGSVTATYSDIQGGWEGTGNIDSDPLFFGTGEHPYLLLEDSPCIDAGIPDTTGLNLPLWDIIGNLRIWDGDGDGIAIIDMGAYEYAPTGSLEGHVYEDTAAGRDIIEGALVVVEGTIFNTYTDETGYYNFPYVFTGNYDVTASAFGYYDETNNVTITEDETTQQDFYLDQLPNVEVSGHVITSDTGEDVVGAFVELEGFDFYETFTGDDGLFTLPGVYSDHIYTLTISGYEGYETYVDENVVVGETNLDLGDIIMNELAYPPFGVYVEEDHNGFAEMIWHASGSTLYGMEDFEDGEANDYLFNEPQDRWSVDDGYLKFTGQSLGSNGSAYWDNEVEDFTMEFEVQKNSGNGDYAHGAFIRADGFLGAASCNGYRFNITQNGYYCVIRYDNGSYTFIQGWTTAINLLTGFGVPNIVTIVASGADFELYFNGVLEYTFSDATHPSGFCNVIAYDIQGDEVWFDYVNIMQDTRVVADISNFISITGNTAPGGDENKAPEKMYKFSSNSVEIRDLKLITESKISSINSTPTRERLMEGYDIYRLLDGEQEQPENWVEIVLGVTDTTYTDESWAYLEIPGAYRYAIIAVFTNNVYSNPSFSNILEKEMYTEVIVNVTTNSGDDPTGANVTLTNQDEYPAHVYTMTAPTPTDGVCFFQDVYPGVYNLEVNLTGFEAYLQENINIFDVITLPVELTEIIGVLGELTGEEIGNGEIFLTWTWAGAVNLLFIDDDGSAYLEFTDTQPFYIDLFDEIGIDYSIHNIYEDFADGPDAAAMAPYDVVFWECGEQFSMGRTITANDEANLGTYIDGGGKVIISAYDYFYDIYPAAGAFSAGQFPYDYLGVASANQDANNLFFPDEIAINGTGGSYVDGLSVILTDIFSSRDGVYMDYLTSNAIGSDYTLYDGNVVGILTDNTIFTTAGYPGMIDGTNTVVEYLMESINNLFCARDREFLGFTISRDEAKIATDVMDMTYTDHVDSEGSYEYTVTANYTTGNSNTISTTVVVVSSPSNTIPFVTKLTGNYPNPFNPTNAGSGRSPITNISFSISEASQVTIDIYNLRGEKVNTLVNEYLEPNYYNVEWNGRDENNRSVASGVYFYKMKAGDFQKVRKMILLR